MGLADLSVELLVNILQCLTPKSMVNMRLISRYFNYMILTNLPHVMPLHQGMGDKFIAELLYYRFCYDRDLFDKVERITNLVESIFPKAVNISNRWPLVWRSLANALTYCCGRDWVIKHITNPLEWAEEWSDTETLLLAAWLQCGHRVQELLDSGLDVDVRHEHLGSLMYAAAFNDDDSLAKILIERGVTLQHPVEAYGDPLQLAAYLNSERIVHRLIFSGLTLRANNISVGYGPFGSPLGAAAAAGHVGLITVLAYKFQSSEVVGPGSKTPLHYAVSNGHAETIIKLLEFRVDVGLSEDDDGLSAFERAAIAGNRDVVDAFLDFLFLEEIEETQALNLACHYGHKEIVQSLLDHDFPPDFCVGGTEPPLCCAAVRGYFEIVDLLLDRIESHHVNATRNLLTGLAAEGSEPMFKHILASGKVDVNECDMNGDNALHVACRCNRPSIVKALLRIPELDPNMEDDEDATALSIALDLGCEEIVELLNNDRRVKLGPD